MPIEPSVVLVALKAGGMLVTAGRTICDLVSGEKNRQFQKQQRIASENFQRERDAINYLREAELRMKVIEEQHKNALEMVVIYGK